MDLGSKVALRSIKRADAMILMELNNDQSVAEFVVGTPIPTDYEQQLAWMQRLENEENTKRWMITFDDEPVGTVIVSSIDLCNAVGNMNIKILPAFQGRGIAKSALMQACDRAFDEINLFCLTANILSYNTRSIALFKKVGFSEEGVLRSRVVKNGVRCDLVELSLLKSERMPLRVEK